LRKPFLTNSNRPTENEVLQMGEDVMDEIARKHGTAGLFRLFADIVIRVPLEYLSEMRRDMRYAWRAMLKSPGFALTGIISIGIGIGLTTNVYSSKWQTLFRPLPSAANSQRLVMAEKPVSYYYIEQYREQKSLFTGVAGLEIRIPFNINFQGDGNANPQRVFGQLVSVDYFSVLGIQPQRGRVLSPALDKPGNAPVVVISDRFWRNRLDSSPDAVGQTLRLNGQAATIVGITPKDFNGALSFFPAELFVPITAPAALAPELGNDVLHQRGARDFLALICLAPGVNTESAEAALDTITRRLDEQDPSAPRSFDKTRRVTLLSAGTMVPLPRNLKLPLIVFFLVLTGLIMTIVCMNLANMLLARGANRRKELAIRLAVGASRFRLVRQMISEGILLSVLGGIAGYGIAYGIAILNSRFKVPTEVPQEFIFTPDWHAMAFVLILALVCGIGFSLIPALRATKADMTPALKQGSALQFPEHWRFGLRNLLMVAQVAGSLTLLLITGFLVIGFSQTSIVQTKFDPRTMYLFSIDPMHEGYSLAKAQAFFEKLPQQLMTIPSVRSVTLAAQPPFSIDDANDPVQLIAQDSGGASRTQTSAVEETVGAGYFAALNESLLAGREFADLDQRIQPDATNALPVVLNQTAAYGFFGNGNAIGEHIRDEKQSYEVVGVVHDLKSGLTENPSIVYLPLTQRDFARPPAGAMVVMVRSDAGMDALAGIRREVASMDHNLILFNVRTLNEDLDRTRAAERFSMSTYAGMGLFGLVLAAIGLAGITAYTVAQRRKEIGIRMALGALKIQVLRLVLREGTVLVSVGTVLGFLSAVAVARILSALTSIFAQSMRLGTSDPRLIAGAPLLLAVLTMLACYVPARKALEIDPLKALRQE